MKFDASSLTRPCHRPSTTHGKVQTFPCIGLDLDPQTASAANHFSVPASYPAKPSNAAGATAGANAAAARGSPQVVPPKLASQHRPLCGLHPSKPPIRRLPIPEVRRPLPKQCRPATTLPGPHPVASDIVVEKSGLLRLNVPFAGGNATFREKAGAQQRRTPRGHLQSRSSASWC